MDFLELTKEDQFVINGGTLRLTGTKDYQGTRGGWRRPTTLTNKQRRTRNKIIKYAAIGIGAAVGKSAGARAAGAIVGAMVADNL